jgi:hypothetical protein
MYDRYISINSLRRRTYGLSRRTIIRWLRIETYYEEIAKVDLKVMIATDQRDKRLDPGILFILYILIIY